MNIFRMEYTLEMEDLEDFILCFLKMRSSDVVMALIVDVFISSHGTDEQKVCALFLKTPNSQV